VARSRSLQQPGWLPYSSAQLPGANGGQGGVWWEEDNPKRLFERRRHSARGGKISRRKQGAKAAPCPGVAEGQGEGPEMFCAARVPLGRGARGFPSWSGFGSGRGEAACPLCLEILPEKAIEGGKE